MNKIMLIIGIALVLIIGGYFLLQRGYRAPQEPETQAPAPNNEEIVIVIQNHKITNPEITVSVGTAVTWRNADNLAGFPYDNHTSTSGTVDPTGTQGKQGVVPNSGSGVADGTFELALSSGESKSFTFTQAGTYLYYIAEHPLVSGDGSVTVIEPKAADTAKVISMESGSFFFSKKTIEAKAGESVIIDITATGQHTFTIDELGVNVSTPNGTTTRVEFTPEEKGTFQFYCAIPGHREGGQIGIITVE